jgi:hypothetical protein
MNLLAHAEVVRRLGYDQPEHLMGAMLPDLAGIARFRIPELSPGPMADGVAWHHRTDEVFHGSLRFRNWCADTTHHLLAAGLGRGAARASAHLAVEMIIDGELVRITNVANEVEIAVTQTRPAVMAMLPDSATGHRFDQVLRWITDGGLRVAYQDPDAVSLRIERVLSRRPRLALPAGGREHCARELRTIEPLVAPLVPCVIDEAVAPLAR